MLGFWPGRSGPTVTGEVTSASLQAHEVPDFVDLGVESYLLILVITFPSRFFKVKIFERHSVSCFSLGVCFWIEKGLCSSRWRADLELRCSRTTAMPIQTCSLPQRPGEVTLLPQISAFPERETSCLHTKHTHRHTHTRIQTYTQILEHRFKDWKTTNSKEFLNTYYTSSTMLGSIKCVPSKCFLLNWKASNILLPTGKHPLSTCVLRAFLYSLSNPIRAQVWFILLSRSYFP